MNFINFLTAGVTCGENVEIGGTIVNIIRVIYNAIKIGVPIILIIIGMVGMGKAIAAQKEDEIKKAQSLLIKQAVAAVLVFLMFQIVQIVMSVLNVKNSSNWSCVQVILSEPDENEDCYLSTDKDSATGKWHKNGTGDNEVWKCTVPKENTDAKENND